MPRQAGVSPQPALLGLLLSEPKHGYELFQEFSRELGGVWRIGQSQLYAQLKQLEESGLVSVRVEEQPNRPARKVYHVTEAGRRAWHEALLHTLSVPQLKSSGLMVGLSNLSALERDEVLAALRAYHRALGDRLTHVEETWTRQHPVLFHVEALFDYGVTMLKAEREWVNGFIDRLLDRRQGDRGEQG